MLSSCIHLKSKMGRRGEKHQFYHGVVPRINFTFIVEAISTSSKKHRVRRANHFLQLRNLELQKIAPICFTTFAFLSFRPKVTDERVDSAFCTGDIHSSSPCVNRFQSRLTPNRNGGRTRNSYFCAHLGRNSLNIHQNKKCFE